LKEACRMHEGVAGMHRTTPREDSSAFRVPLHAPYSSHESRRIAIDHSRMRM
jgi:hypothetical protein